LIKGCQELEAEMSAGCLKDIGRDHFFTYFAETAGIIATCEHTLKNLDSYMSDIDFDPPLAFAPNTNRIKYEPLGVSLILGSWNYPYYVTLKPLA
jgi:aldehyde dehydrogenase (NAD+)